MRTTAVLTLCLCIISNVILPNVLSADIALPGNEGNSAEVQLGTTVTFPLNAVKSLLNETNPLTAQLALPVRVMTGMPATLALPASSFKDQYSKIAALLDCQSACDVASSIQLHSLASFSRDTGSVPAFPGTVLLVIIMLGYLVVLSRSNLPWKTVACRIVIARPARNGRVFHLVRRYER